MGAERYRSRHFDEAETAFRAAMRLLGGINTTLIKTLSDVILATGRWATWLEELRTIYQTESMVLRYLEMDIAYACNLNCTGCSHYSNYKKNGIIDYDEGSKWMIDWSQRILPIEFRLLGGEPTLNPRLCDYIRLAAELWPNSIRAVVSNGFFVDRHPELYNILAKTGTRLDISIHDYSAEYQKNANFEQIKAASLVYGFHVDFYSFPVSDFRRLYQGDGEGMTPFSDNNPEKSWQNCLGPICAFLNNGLLWKCAPVGLLSTINEQFKLSINPQWQPYINHKGLEPQATDKEIMDYLLGHNQVCGMCPANDCK